MQTTGFEDLSCASAAEKSAAVRAKGEARTVLMQAQLQDTAVFAAANSAGASVLGGMVYQTPGVREAEALIHAATQQAEAEALGHIESVCLCLCVCRVLWCLRGCVCVCACTIVDQHCTRIHINAHIRTVCMHAHMYICAHADVLELERALPAAAAGARAAGSREGSTARAREFDQIGG